MSASAPRIYPAGTRVFHPRHGACVILEHLSVTVLPHGSQPRLTSATWRPCQPGEAPTHYTLKTHTKPEMIPVEHIERTIVDEETARELVAYLETGAAEPLDRLAEEGLILPNPPPRKCRAYDIQRDMSAREGARVLRAYYELSEEGLSAGPLQWLASFERLILGELAMAIGAPFEGLRDQLHRGHPGVAAHDAKAQARIAARNAAREQKSRKKPAPLP